jgi:AcrR family transcriptional regulator
MLIHHFGSKDALWVAIVQEVERRELEAVASFATPGTATFEDAMRAWWRHISDPSLWPNERLFFEVYANGLRGQGPSSALLEGIVESWVAPTAALAAAYGVPAAQARAFARLGVAVTRGLLLDVVATGDRAGVDAAMEEWIALAARAVRR